MVQVRRRAAEKWKDVDAAAISTRLHVVSNLLKVECCVNGSHSMDDVGLGAFGLYKTLPGLDCTFPGFVPQLCIHAVYHLFAIASQAHNKDEETDVALCGCW